QRADHPGCRRQSDRLALRRHLRPPVPGQAAGRDGPAGGAQAGLRGGQRRPAAAAPPPNVAAIDRPYEKRLNELEVKHQATPAARAELRKDRDQARAVSEKIVEELARRKPDPSSSDLYQRAVSLSLEGKPEEALELLDEGTLRRSVEAARQSPGDGKAL